MACIDNENGEIYLTPLEEENERLEGKILLYETFIKIVNELIEDSEDGKINVEDMKINLNDLKKELDYYA